MFEMRFLVFLIIFAGLILPVSAVERLETPAQALLEGVKEEALRLQWRSRDIERQRRAREIRRRAAMASRAKPSRVLVRSRGRWVEVAPFIARYARENKLDPWLVYAVIKVESNMRADVGSPYGAVGLMQLLPATARTLGCSDIYDPEQNIAAGCRYLGAHVRKFGSVDAGLAAYNAGPGAVQRYGGVPPYPETRAYVRKVRQTWERARKRSKS